MRKQAKSRAYREINLQNYNINLFSRRKFRYSRNATNQTKSTVELCYICQRGTEPSSVIPTQTKWFKHFKEWCPKVSKQAKAERWCCNKPPKIIISILTQKTWMLSKRFESTEVDRKHTSYRLAGKLGSRYMIQPHQWDGSSNSNWPSSVVLQSLCNRGHWWRLRFHFLMG